MNYEMVIEELKKWDEDEKFYRDFYHFISTATRNNAELKQFFEEQKPRQRDIDIVLHPSEIHPYETEELFFSSDRNVMLIKHPRYIPYFEHQHALIHMDKYSDHIICNLLTIFFAQLTRCYGRTVYISITLTIKSSMARKC